MSLVSESGDGQEDAGNGLSHDLMALQVGVYGMAARGELRYGPRHELIRHIGERNDEPRQVRVELNEQAHSRVLGEVIETGLSISERRFGERPTGQAEKQCRGCDVFDICLVT